VAAGQGARQQDAGRLVGYTPPKPKFIGRRVFKNFDLAELARYIDWGPFFQTWDLAGPFPAILKDEIVGAEAVRVLSDGQRMLKRLIEGRWLTANAVMGFWPANSVNDDDIQLYTDESASSRRSPGTACASRPRSRPSTA
jgi:5-methyltetrahydrofolate--homocysteine methyltransferase